MEFSAIDITQILVTLVSTTGAIIIAFLGRRAEGAERPMEVGREAKKPPLSRWTLGMWACIAIAALNTVILGWRLLRPVDAAITYPANQARVDQIETVRGTVQGLPAGQVIWVVIFPQEVGRYYPQNWPADLEAGGEWSSITYIGVPSDTGKRFDVLVVLADAEAQNAFNAYLADARDRADWPGLEALPSGAVIYDRITVTRNEQ